MMNASHRLRAIGLLVATVLTASGAAPALADDKDSWPPPTVSYFGDPKSPDISGLWLGSAMATPGGAAETNSGTTADGRPPVHWAPWPLPYTAKYRKIFDERVAATKKGVALGDIGSRCLPFGLPMLLSSKVFPDEVVQTPGQVTIFMYNSFPVVIWTDGRPHPKDLQPSYNGHSIGHWDGDMLFVDTVGINGRTPIDTMRNPHSDKIHIKWSMQRVSKNVLHVHLTLFDETAFTEPVTMTNIWHRMTDRRWEVLDDASCFENNTKISDKPVEEGFIKF